MFLALFLWFCFAATPGDRTWSLREWPVNLFLHADPLLALTLWLCSGTLAVAFVWALLVIALTVIFGRFFCGWVCPLGTLQQFSGWLVRRRRPAPEQVRANVYRRLQSAKYLILAMLLTAAIAGGISRALNTRAERIARIVAGSLQSGLLDPLCLTHRGVNLAFLPLADRAFGLAAPQPRFHVQAVGVAALFLGALLACWWIPRFYCRFVCPLGALFGLIGRWSLWRVGKISAECSVCQQCERDCEGACSIATRLRSAECVLCLNCLQVCPDGIISYRASFPAETQYDRVDVTRRGVLVSVISGLAAVPLMRLAGLTGRNFNPRCIRPPGALPEPDFLSRCIKCGQCMRVCPSNIIQPAAWEGGVEGLWTPVLNYRIGSGGCIPTCLECGRICPTGALRPLTVEERLGEGAYARAGPVRMGLAFIDRGRCLPWAMSRPCIVCQEVCPVSPKAIYLTEEYRPLRFGVFRVARADELTLSAGEGRFESGRLAVGDIYVRTETDPRLRRIVSNTADEITVDSSQPYSPSPKPGTRAELLIRLQLPVVDPRYCIGCGICEFHCPVAGLKAIRVSAENETRHPDRRVTLFEIGGIAS